MLTPAESHVLWKLLTWDEPTLNHAERELKASALRKLYVRAQESSEGVGSS